MRGLKTYFFVLSLLAVLPFLMAQDSPVIKESEWEKSTKGIDYTENYKEVKPDEEQKDETQNTNSLSSPSLSYDWSGLKYVFYIVVVGLVLFLIIKILSNLNKNPNIKKQDISIESIEEIEEKMHEIDLDQLLIEAIRQENYHIALRINFLIIIKLLSERNAIVWAKEKTNWEYYSEIKDIVTKDGFKSIVLVFEPVWYGEQQITKDGFSKLQPVFDGFKNQLKINE